VLTDFGISRVFDPKGNGETVIDPVQTIVQMRDGKNPVMGSLGYMAPELELGLQATPKSDWYALGVLVYRLLTGTWCDARTDVAATLETYDPVWRRIIPKLLHSNPEGRACLSYAAEKARDAEMTEAALEEKWLREKVRGHFARHAARWLAAVLLLSGLAAGYIVLSLRTRDNPWRARVLDVRNDLQRMVSNDDDDWSFMDEESFRKSITGSIDALNEILEK